MNKVICPVSSHKIQSHLPRITALFVIGSIIAYTLSGSWYILLALIIDFTARATNNSKFSITFQAAKGISRTLRVKSPLIDSAPKIFAARLGAIMFLAAFALHLLGFTNTSVSISLLVGLLATLECVFNFCVGCVIYTTIVFPLFAKH